MSINRFWNWRYPLAAGLAILAVFVVVTLFLPEKAAATVVVVKHEVCAGCEITAKDVGLSALAPSGVPRDRYQNTDRVIGKTAAVNLSSGTVLQPALLVENAVEDLRTGEVAFAVEVSDPAVAGFSKTGQRVEIWCSGGNVDGELLASNARVVGVKAVSESFLGTGNSASIAYLAAPEDEARRVIAAKADYDLSFVVRR